MALMVCKACGLTQQCRVKFRRGNDAVGSCSCGGTLRHVSKDERVDYYLWKLAAWDRSYRRKERG
jgi:hypothetical protein